MRKPRAIVAGGSLGGLLAGNLLHRAGWDVRVYERAEGPLDARGAGIVTHPELREILFAAGVARDAPLGVWVDTRCVIDQRGRVIGEQRLRQCLTGWSRLHQLLLEVFPRERYTSGVGVTGCHDRGDRVTATLADGTSVDADLLVAADGIRSTLRAQLAPTVAPKYAGYVAWRGLVEEAALSAATHAALFERFAFCLPDREQMLGYPVAGAHDDVSPGKRRYNFVWYRPADAQTLRELSTDATGTFHDAGIPPPLIRPEVVAGARRAAHELLAPAFAEVVERAAAPFFQPIFDVESPRLDFGRVALLGDAAFVARPHCGMGVTKAAGDARALVHALAAASGDVPRAVAAYAAARRPYGAKVVAHARHLGAYMQAQLASDEERAMAERYRTPEAVMEETAVPL